MIKSGEFRRKTLLLFKEIKSNGRTNQLIIPIYEKNRTVAKLKLITSDFTNEEVKLLAERVDNKI